MATIEEVAVRLISMRASEVPLSWLKLVRPMDRPVRHPPGGAKFPDPSWLNAGRCRSAVGLGSQPTHRGYLPRRTAPSQLMMPNQVNNLGNVFGGEILSMVDRAAAVAAMRHAGRPCVTVAIDRVDFREPIRSGELVTCSARVNYVGTTSIEVGVRVDAENPLTGVKRHTNTCLLTFVAIDEACRPTPVPPLDLTDPDDRRRYEEGRERRRGRLELT